LSYRRVNPRLVVDDEVAVLNWAREHLPQAVVSTERLSKSALDEAMRTTGIIPSEGAHVVPEARRFYIR
jgi:hypothetical protein